MTTETQLEPLAVYDANDGSYSFCDQFKPFDQWVIDQGISLDDTHRIEIHLIDTLFARVFQVLRNADGKIYCPLDHEHHYDSCEIARRTVDVPVSCMPPVQPLPAWRIR